MARNDTEQVPFLLWPLRLPQVFYNQGLSSLCRCVSYVFDTLVTGKADTTIDEHFCAYSLLPTSICAVQYV